VRGVAGLPVADSGERRFESGAEDAVDVPHWSKRPSVSQGLLNFWSLVPQHLFDSGSDGIIVSLRGVLDVEVPFGVPHPLFESVDPQDVSEGLGLLLTAPVTVNPMSSAFSAAKRFVLWPRPVVALHFWAH
jgi:hypothetical protein